MSEDKFFERLRSDASVLRYEPDAVAIARVSARIRARVAAQPTIAQPTIAQLLTAWFRPLAATLTAVALAAAIGITLVPEEEVETLGENPVEISLAGDRYHVGD